MRSVWLITRKNLKLLVRTKLSALIVIFAPLLIILIIGLSFNTSSNLGLNIGVYSSTFTADVESFITTLQQENYKVVKYEDSIEECVEDIKFGFVHTCIDLPESFKIDGNAPKEITFHLDPSKINLVYMVQETLKSKLNFKSQEISQEITANILSKLASTKSTLSDKNSLLSVAKDSSSSLSSSSGTYSSSLSSLDLQAVTLVYNTTLISQTTSSISTAQGKVTDAKTAVTASGLSDEEKQTITLALDSAASELASAAGMVKGPGSDNLENVISSLEGQVGVLSGKINAASGTVQSISSSLGGTSSSLSEISSTLSSVVESLTAVHAELDALPVTNAETITSPLITKIERVGREGTYLNYLFPSLLVLVVMFTSLLLGTTLVMMEKNSPAFLRNFFLPLKKATFIISTYLTNLILIIIQVVIILTVSLIFLEDSLSMMPLIFLILLVGGSVFTFLGMALGYVFTSEETGVLASISLGSIMLFLSGVILPLESVSPFLREITFYNPFVITEKLIREVFIFQTNIGGMGVDFLTLISYAIFLFLVILVAESLLHQHIVDRFMRSRHRLQRQKERRVKIDF
ncbi:MAG TPA: ABC transporter permease [Candidatus Nanoarchaeia archaeon]|nr:ABC transporter permease [Candidatus Nanoarchaeia archaeon]